MLFFNCPAPLPVPTYSMYWMLGSPFQQNNEDLWRGLEPERPGDGRLNTTVPAHDRVIGVDVLRLEEVRVEGRLHGREHLDENVPKGSRPLRLETAILAFSWRVE